MARLPRQLYMNGMYSYIYSSIEMRNFDFGDTPLDSHSNMKPVKQVYFGVLGQNSCGQNSSGHNRGGQNS